METNDDLKGGVSEQHFKSTDTLPEKNSDSVVN